MTEEQLLELGFERQEDFDGNEDYHYYTLFVARGVQFISNANDEIKEGEEWYVEFFESEPTIRWRDFETFKQLLSAIEKGEKIS